MPNFRKKRIILKKYDMENTLSYLTSFSINKDKVDALKMRINQLDLSLITDRLKYKYNWSMERIATAIAEYKDFLLFTETFNNPVSPTPDGDFVWHEHLIHSNKYQLDCNFLFGKFLHHLPVPIRRAATLSNCSSPCCNKSDCCNDNPTKEVINYDKPDLSLLPEPIAFNTAYNQFIVAGL